MIHEYISYGFDSNVFVIENSKTILVDAGTGMTDSLNRFINSFKIDLVINTHCHIDHVGGDPMNVPIAIGEKDAEDLERGTEKTIFDFVLPFFRGFKVSKRLKDGETIDWKFFTLRDIQMEVYVYMTKLKRLYSQETPFL